MYIIVKILLIENAYFDKFHYFTFYQVILDHRNSTAVQRISGLASPATTRLPVIFLLRQEAVLLRRLLEEMPNRTATIQGNNIIEKKFRLPNDRYSSTLL